LTNNVVCHSPIADIQGIEQLFEYSWTYPASTITTLNEIISFVRFCFEHLLDTRHYNNTGDKNASNNSETGQMEVKRMP
jgi:hypothetical protein